MKLGVMSDSHGHLTEMRRAATRMLEEFGVDMVAHLGDDSTDADALRGLVPELVSVPGIYETRYKDPVFPNRVMKDIGGVNFLFTHTPTRDPRDLPGDTDPTEAAENGEADVVLYGHTHKPEASEKHGAVYVNPGHIKGSDDRGSPMTFAVVEILKPRINVKIVELNGGILDERLFLIE